MLVVIIIKSSWYVGKMVNSSVAATSAMRSHSSQKRMVFCMSSSGSSSIAFGTSLMLWVR